MPKTKTAVKDMKQKLTAAERSQIAKDRWAKRRKNEPQEIHGIAANVIYAPPETNFPVQGFIEDNQPTAPQPPEQPPVTPESGIDNGMSGEPVNLAPFRPAPTMNSVPYDPSATAQQLIPVAPKKQRRYTGPKEFSVALKAAESRLAKAVVERAEYSGKLAAVQAEIPSLLQIIAALKGQQNIPVVNYDPYTNASFQTPMPQQYAAPQNPLAAIQAAMATPPVSRASGGAMQFSPEMVGSLEGPDDDDPDRFIAGPNAGGGWIGG